VTLDLSSRMHPRRHAIVVGASIGGLCAAEVLARHFDQVTVVERDALPASPDELRRGVPQGAHPHGILARGRKELESLFPGMMQRLLAAGAFSFDGSYDMARYTPEGWAPRHRDVQASAFACSRPLLELTIRQTLLARRPNVHFIEGTRLVELLHEKRDGGVWVTGVRTDAKDPALRELSANLVVDATGRGTKTWKWLSELGLDKPHERRVDAKVNYATRHYRAPKEARDWWWRCLLVDNFPPRFKRAGAILNVENDRWLVTASGINADYAPTDEASWMAFMKSLRSPLLYEVLQRAEPISDIIQNRSTVNVWKEVHRWAAPLHGLLLYGDAICTFNPAYGQGMTAASLAAQLLDAELRDDAGPISKAFLQRFYKKQARFLEEGWAYSTTLDLRWPDTEGERPFYYGALCELSYLMERIAIHDPHMLRKLVPLVDFGVSRYAVFTPPFLLRSALGLARRIVARPSLPGPRDIDLFAPADGKRVGSPLRIVRPSDAA
jgi:2-polyprenyl-6-methoxyphenol hydroxylase-like FAD-dependent oxidoreductase